jgi:hypothetical protein
VLKGVMVDFTASRGLVAGGGGRGMVGGPLGQFAKVEGGFMIDFGGGGGCPEDLLDMTQQNHAYCCLPTD